MSKPALKLYPSGFLGSASVAQTQAKDLAMATKQLFNRSYLPKTSPYTASLEVLELWSTIVSEEKTAQSFEFKERVLRAALQHFGTERLIDWIEAQWTSPEYGDNHARWIDETLEFVFAGQRRILSANGWCAILTAGENDSGLKAHSKIVKQHLFNGAYLTNRSTLTIPQFLTNWVRRPRGIEDLASSLRVLFGTR